MTPAIQRRDFLKVIGGMGAVLALPAQQVLAVTKELVLAGPAEMTETVRFMRDDSHRITFLRFAAANNRPTGWFAATNDDLIWGLNEVMVSPHDGFVEIQLSHVRRR